MIENSKVLPYAELVNEAISILEISKKVIEFYKKLAKLNTAFGSIFIISEKKPIYELIEVTSEKAAVQLAEEILFQNKKDIIKIDKVGNPSINYVRLGQYIHFSLGVEVENDPFLTLTFSFIYSDRIKSKIGTIIASKNCFKDVEDCMCFIETIRGSFETEYACMKLSFFDSEISNDLRKYKAPLGLITFFSNSTYNEIPCCLEGVECILLDEGKIFIIENTNLFDEDVEIKSIAMRLLNLMKQIEIYSPSYSKTFIPPLD